MKKVIEEKADLGITWDGDADRCFFIDNNGSGVYGYIIPPENSVRVLSANLPLRQIISLDEHFSELNILIGIALKPKDQS